jgi:hypothetical protein
MWGETMDDSSIDTLVWPVKNTLTTFFFFCACGNCLLLRDIVIDHWHVLRTRMFARVCPHCENCLLSSKSTMGRGEM